MLNYLSLQFCSLARNVVLICLVSRIGLKAVSHIVKLPVTAVLLFDKECFPHHLVSRIGLKAVSHIFKLPIIAVSLLFGKEYCTHRLVSHIVKLPVTAVLLFDKECCPHRLVSRIGLKAVSHIFN